MKKLLKISSCIIAISFFTGCAVIYARQLQADELNKLKQVGLSCFLFANDHAAKFPKTTAQLKTYLGNEFDFSNVKIIEKNKKLTEFKTPSRTILAVSTKRLANDNYAALFIDGHCELISKEKYKKIANE